METFKIHILGCGSALPTIRHFPSAQIIEMKDKAYIVDCGEGTQIQLRHTGIRFSRIEAVFISHLHGDHCLGLIGLLSTFSLLGRITPLHIYAPAAYEEMFAAQMELFCPYTGYDISFHPVDTTAATVIHENGNITVSTLPLEHRVPCCGYLFKEKPSLPHIRKDMIDLYKIPVKMINGIKNGGGWTTEDGVTVPHELLVTPSDEPRSYAYCSDTRYLPELHKMIKGVSTLYHETTYCDDKATHAADYYHSTARQAAAVARDAGAGKLLIGHYSSKYADESLFLNEAREVFDNTFLTDELLVFDV